MVFSEGGAKLHGGISFSGAVRLAYRHRRQKSKTGVLQLDFSSNFF